MPLAAPLDARRRRIRFRKFKLPGRGESQAVLVDLAIGGIVVDDQYSKCGGGEHSACRPRWQARGQSEMRTACSVPDSLRRTSPRGLCPDPVALRQGRTATAAELNGPDLKWT